MSTTGQHKREANSSSPAVLFASAEVFPFSKVGGLGDVAGSLPRALQEVGCTMAVVSPQYGFIDWSPYPPLEALCTITVEIGERRVPCTVSRLKHNGVPHYFLGNDSYFGRADVYGFDDDLERFALFSRAICECALHLGHYVHDFRCDVIHCNDWHTALVPVYMRAYADACSRAHSDAGLDAHLGASSSARTDAHPGATPGASSGARADARLDARSRAGTRLDTRLGRARSRSVIRTVLTVHNACFQGEYPSERLNAACGFAEDSAAARQMHVRAGISNCLAGGLRCADWITTVSPRYAEEIQHVQGSGQLAGILCQRSDVLSGIINGIDQDVWNPETDSALASTYHVNDLSGKELCKRALLRELDLTHKTDQPEQPLAVMVSRLSEQKGFDVLCPCLPDIADSGIQVVILGTGETRFTCALEQLSRRYPDNIRHIDAFDEQMAHRLYAAGDMLIMPSQFEPCGLSQLIALRYGTLPVVRDTGGLHDTVQPYNPLALANDRPHAHGSTGFVFSDATPEALYDCVLQAATLYRHNSDACHTMQRHAMRADFGWEQSAQAYREVYEHIGKAQQA